jgi:hypothetical protein
MKVDELRRPPETVLEHIADGANVVVGVTNGEPVRILEPIGAMKGLVPRRLTERPHPGRSPALRLLRGITLVIVATAV